MSPVAVAIIAVVLVAALAGMARSWRRRAARQRDLTLPEPPADTGTPIAAASGLHLVTTFAGRPLERVVAGGLGFRARVRITAGETGVLVERAGGADLFIGVERLIGSGSATWALDRAVERDGLTVLAWRLGDGAAATDVESSFRLDPEGRTDLEDALRALLPVPVTQEVPRADD